jgi:2'-5' RNA ligase
MALGDGERLFVSVEVPHELRERIAKLAQELPQDAISPVRPDNMHLTLRFIGEVPERMAGDIGRRLRGVEFGKFTVRLRGAGVFPDEDYVRVVWAGAESPELDALAKKVIEALRGIGKEEARGFSAHLTIARVKRKIDVKEFLQKHSNDEFGTFEVNEFYLMRSELKPGTPPRYTVVAAFGARISR